MGQNRAPEVDPDVAIAAMPQYLDRAKAGSMDKSIQINLSGEQGGTWWLKIKDGGAETGKGEIDEPDLTLSADAADYVDILQGTLDGASAFMTGRLRVKGDMGLAISFGGLFKRPS